MKPIRIIYVTNNSLQAFTKSNSFAGWLLRCKCGWVSRPSNGWKPSTFDTLTKAERYLIASIKSK